MQDLGIRLKYTEQYCMSTTSLQVANKVYPLFVYTLPESACAQQSVCAHACANRRLGVRVGGASTVSGQSTYTTNVGVY